MIRLRLVALAFALTLTGAKKGPPPPSVEWITLGTSGGPVAQKARSKIANALVVGDAIYLFDTGNGIQRQMAFAGLDERRVRAIFISHHHIDHNADLGSLMIANWMMGPGQIYVYGPVGTRALVGGLAAANAPTVLASFPTSGPARPDIIQTVRATDVPADMDKEVEVYRDDRIRVIAVNVNHYELLPTIPIGVMPQALGYRIEAGGKVIAYTGDTGPSRRMENLARKADLLVSEIVEPDARTAAINRNMAAATPAARANAVEGLSKNHLTPREVGRLARSAGVKSLVLTHFIPVPEETKGEAAWLTGIRANYKGPVKLARDLERFRP